MHQASQSGQDLGELWEDYRANARTQPKKKNKETWGGKGGVKE